MLIWFTKRCLNAAKTDPPALDVSFILCRHGVAVRLVQENKITTKVDSHRDACKVYRQCRQLLRFPCRGCTRWRSQQGASDEVRLSLTFRCWLFFLFGNVATLQDAILKLGPLPRLLNDISVALRNPQLHMPTNHQPDRPKDRLFSRPSFNRLKSSDFQSHMMRDLNRSVSLLCCIPGFRFKVPLVVIAGKN